MKTLHREMVTERSRTRCPARGAARRPATA